MKGDSLASTGAAAGAGAPPGGAGAAGAEGAEGAEGAGAAVALVAEGEELEEEELEGRGVASSSCDSFSSVRWAWPGQCLLSTCFFRLSDVANVDDGHSAHLNGRSGTLRELLI